MRRALLIGLCAAFCVAQSPDGPDISAYYRMHATDAPLYKWLRVDPPLMVTVDAAGRPHLAIGPGQFGNCIIGDNLWCKGSLSAGDGTRPSEIEMRGLAVNGTNFVSVVSPPEVTITYRLQWPADPPKDGQQLVYGPPDPLTRICVGRWVTP